MYAYHSPVVVVLVIGRAARKRGVSASRRGKETEYERKC
jgi:hypothetical protein